jgi:hypothetical protein
MKLWVILGLLTVVALTPMENAWAGLGLFTNGDFEAGSLTGWDSVGDTGVSTTNVLSGTYSAFLTTGGDAAGGICSYLLSGLLFPTAIPHAVDVTFKVRYKTDEGIGPYAVEDPFVAELMTGQGTVELVTIKADGITPGPRTKVINQDTGLRIPPTPTIPPTIASPISYVAETPTLIVTSRIPYASCDPVLIKFSICDYLSSFADSTGDSAAYLDDVVMAFSVSPHGDPCAGEMNVPAKASSVRRSLIGQ